MARKKSTKISWEELWEGAPEDGEILNIEGHFEKLNIERYTAVERNGGYVVERHYGDAEGEWHDSSIIAKDVPTLEDAKAIASNDLMNAVEYTERSDANAALWEARRRAARSK